MTLDKLKLLFSKTGETPKITGVNWQSDLAFWGAKYFVTSLIYVWIAYPKKAVALSWLLLSLCPSETKASTKESQRPGNLDLVQTQPLIQGEPEHTVPLDCLCNFRMSSQWILACLFKFFYPQEIKKSQNINLQLIWGLITRKINICVTMHRFQRPWVRAAQTSMPINFNQH